MPFWSSVDQTLKQVDKKIAGLQDGAAAVDAQMAKYQQIDARPTRRSTPSRFPPSPSSPSPPSCWRWRWAALSSTSS